MLTLTTDQRRRLLALMVAFHIAVIAASNYLVQLPFTVFGLHTTWGAFSFPFIFLATDLTVRLFGKEPARAIILRVMLPALVISYLVSVIFPKGSYVGMAAFDEVNLFVARIALASFMAYLLGQLLDVQVFDRLRRLGAWWVAPAASTLLGNLVDTLAFFAIAFHAGPDPFMALHWPEIAAVDYAIKLAISLAFFLPLYGVLLKTLTQRLIVATGSADRWPERAADRRG
ncbi:7-cyano-7-deazaguanine/7-aminomethyl-7-deazaguanine transporter [Halomonas sp. DP8Y7-3]|uniref:7-cyano-7-deazaguanine/7-aminomethyl-7- deazaguanine transporter n=1 Tax=Halomonas sp. DP8Y7-3 TaxID=2859079 RepID=UPI001C95C735|nr:7-cyano-7-deazaguanine/7-aminomethyl-7-deazaguanine transporter [Halomonas sp. DP8Y7-3]MBY5927667.1 7-cyano-7-deazaguanine/7-aminomethyl-7-deazaguanine transporter [Halomonas sp. DP8Y7-3]MED5294387.1 7-cyano-7-deazaguanine/7-aminomethyl-7-deazaguanine transporter [Pseudomonadota bacterium]